MGESVLLALAVQRIIPPKADQTASGKKPNIVVIMADDVGTWNISAYHRGMMGGRTPNIDRIAREGPCSPITTLSNPARRGGPRSSSDRILSAPGY